MVIMCALYLYIFGGVFLFIGGTTWYAEGYSDINLFFVLIGAFPFVFRGLVLLNESKILQQKSFQKGFSRFVVLNPIVWLLIGIYCGDLQDPGWARAVNSIIAVTSIAQLAWLVVPSILKKRKQSEQASEETQSSAPIYDPYYASSLAQAKIERLESEYQQLLSDNAKLSADNEKLHAPYYASSLAQSYISRLSIENQKLKEDLASSKAKIQHLEDAYQKVIVTKPFDEETDAENRRLAEENTRLKNDLLASRNAIDVLNTQLKELKSNPSYILATGFDSVNGLLVRYKDKPTDFENYVASLYRSRTNDGGIDILMEKDGITYSVEVKLYSPDNVVSREQIQKLWAAQLHSNINESIFVTTSRFSSEAIAFAAEHGITLVNGHELERMIKC